MWDSKTGESIVSIPVHYGWVTCLALHPNGEQFASGSDDKYCYVFSCDTFDVVNRISFPNPVYSCVFGADDYLYAGVLDCGIFPAQIDSGAVEGVLVTGQESHVKVAFGEMCARFFCSLVTSF